MALQPGLRLGPYEVVAPIGAGGMGEVYRARDTTLDRDVALKVLPEAFTADPDRLARFEREAKVLASLNHPNIGSIYGLEESGDVRALVLELVEGPTLADRITEGPIPLDKALPIATQIAEALEAAHEQGVIHRDLKPANVKVRDDGTVKVLDFGLAKALASLSPWGEGWGAGDDPSQSPTVTAAGTREGVILGTAAYMSPEQARGKPLDKRTDIWSFGCVLYEMLTGRAAFGGDTLSDTIAKVLEHEPPWEALPAGTPAAIKRLLRRCLDKAPRSRLRDVGDARVEIEEATSTPEAVTSEVIAAPQRQVWQRPVPPVLAALALLAVGGLVVWGVMRQGSPAEEVVRFTITPPDAAPLLIGGGRDLAISRDGTQIVFGFSPNATETQLYRRPIDQLGGETLLTTVDGHSPFVSSDGQWVGFQGGPGSATLQKVSILGGRAQTLAPLPTNVNGASWGADDQIIVGTRAGGLFRVQGGGGEAAELTILDTEHGEISHTRPFTL